MSKQFDDFGAPVCQQPSMMHLTVQEKEMMRHLNREPMTIENPTKDDRDLMHPMHRNSSGWWVILWMILIPLMLLAVTSCGSQPQEQEWHHTYVDDLREEAEGSWPLHLRTLSTTTCL